MLACLFMPRCRSYTFPTMLYKVCTENLRTQMKHNKGGMLRRKQDQVMLSLPSDECGRWGRQSPVYGKSLLFQQ